MNKELFVKYLENPTTMDEPAIGHLASIVGEYPYFQTAHLLYIKALHDNKSIRYSAQLKIAGAYAGDRSMLFRLIKQQMARPVVEAPKPVIENIELFVEEPETAVQSSEEVLELMDFDFSIAEEASPVNSKAEQSNIQPQFLDYVYNLEQKPPLQPEVAVEAKHKRSSQLIDAFIEKNPRIVPRSDMNEQPQKQQDISENSTSESDFLTETLAEIYIRQKNYAKAANIYQKLLLLFPQKSVYFAQKIEQLKELSIQQ